MTMPFALPFPLPGDEVALARLLAQPGGLAATAAGERAFQARAIAGLDLIGLVRLAEAASPTECQTLYESWLAVQGGGGLACAAWFNLGVARMRTGSAAGAAEAYHAALRLKPDMAEAAINLGTALEAAGQVEAALTAWRAALPTPALRQVLHNQLGRVLEIQGRLGPAAEELRASLLIAPHQADVQQHLVHMRQRMTAWPVTELEVPGVSAAEAASNCGPLAALALFDDPAVQAATAADWIARKAPEVGARLAPLQGYRHDRIRIGYLSTDFCRHAMSFLIAELLELHDRSRFVVYGYCASPEDGSAIRARVLAALDHHVRITGLSDAEAAARIREDEIDILIDLNGLTKGARIGVLRWKPAPVQITYLGYIGPVPLPELDYILCDEVTIPAQMEQQYLPKPLRIAGCYQANDSRAPVLPAVSRAGEGLPETAFVYVCVSHHYKITEAMFAGWCAIMAATEGSVLWLIDDNPQKPGGADGAPGGLRAGGGAADFRATGGPRPLPRAAGAGRSVSGHLALQRRDHRLGRLADGVAAADAARPGFRGADGGESADGGGSDRMHHGFDGGVCGPRGGVLPRPGPPPAAEGASGGRCLGADVG